MAPSTRHATCVAFENDGILICGASGTGKSALALQLMALGATLVADDQVGLHVDGNALIATCPASIVGRIEARGVGILNAESRTQAEVALVVDLDQREDKRLPDRHDITILGCVIPLLRGVEGIHLAPAIAQMIRAGRSKP